MKVHKNFTHIAYKNYPKSFNDINAMSGIVFDAMFGVKILASPHVAHIVSISMVLMPHKPQLLRYPWNSSFGM